MTTGALGSISLTTCESGLPFPLKSIDCETKGVKIPSHSMTVKAPSSSFISFTPLMTALFNKYSKLIWFTSLESSKACLMWLNWLVLVLSHGCTIKAISDKEGFSTSIILSIISNISCMDDETPDTPVSNWPSEGLATFISGSILFILLDVVKLLFVSILGK